jgi:hypothetical protein
MEQKRHPFIHNHSKVLNLIKPFEQRPINQINELNGPHIAAEGYQFALTSLKIKFITSKTIFAVDSRFSFSCHSSAYWSIQDVPWEYFFHSKMPFERL